MTEQFMSTTWPHISGAIGTDAYWCDACKGWYVPAHRHTDMDGLRLDLNRIAAAMERIAAALERRETPQ